MNISIRQWKIEDILELKEVINNRKILDNLRDGIPYPYTEENTKEFITAIINAEKDSKYNFAIVLEKAGFELEGTLRNNAIKNGKNLYMKLYSIIK